MKRFHMKGALRMRAGKALTDWTGAAHVTAIVHALDSAGRIKIRLTGGHIIGVVPAKSPNRTGRNAGAR